MSFVSLTLERHKTNNRILAAGTSAGAYIYDERGLTTRRALDFLFDNLAPHKKTSIVWYAASIDVEILLRDLPPREKDKAFASAEGERIKKHIRQRIEETTRQLKEARDVRTLDSLAHRLLKAKRQLFNREHVFYAGYTLTVWPGRQLVIKRDRQSVTIFDIYTFFKKPLAVAARRFLDYCPPSLSRDGLDADLELWQGDNTRRAYRDLIRECVATETRVILQLAEVAAKAFEKTGIELKRWYGISAAANHLLNKWRVHYQFTKQTPENTPRELLDALNRAYYGGHIETFKLGTVYNGHVYDMNAAYPFAATLLSRVSSRWQFTKEYNLYEPFAVWYVHYKLPRGTYLGMLPHRTATGGIVYRAAGEGWYFAPEVRELARKHPDCFTVRCGYVMPYKQVTFAREIESLSEHRRQLKKNGQPEEKLYKMLLQTVCGKFSQTIGQPRYYCLAWAGWITSFVRAVLAGAARGQEHNIICFAQDALHTLEPIPGLRLGEGLGEWKHEQFERGTYLQSGVYQHPNVNKTRGLERVNFTDAVNALNQALNVKAEREFFVGWRMSQTLTEMRGEVYKFMRPYGEKVKEELQGYQGKYLEYVHETISLDPLAIVNRAFDRKNIDWSKEYLDSQMLLFNDGVQSRPRVERDYMRSSNLMLDVVAARRY